MAGKPIQCPVCSTALQVPASKSIRLNCSSADCGQHIVVDVSEAGRFIKCPACDKPLKIPGDPPKPFYSTWAKSDKQELQSSSSEKWPQGKLASFVATWWGRLLLGWGIGAMSLVLLVRGLGHFSQSGLPPHMDEILDEIYLHGIGEFRDTPAQIFGNSMFFLQYVGEDANVMCLNLSTLEEKRITTIRKVSSDMGLVWLGFLPDGQHFAYCARGEAKYGQSFFSGNAANKNLERFILNPKAKMTAGFWLSAQSLVLKCDDGGVYILNESTNGLLGQYGAKGLNKLFSLTDGNQDVALVSSHTIAYVENGEIWNFDLVGGRASKITNFGNGALGGLNYCPEHQKYLFTRKSSANAEDPGLYEYDTVAGTLKILRQGAFGGQWMAGGNACAFCEMAAGKRVLNIRKEDGTLLPSLFNTGAERLQTFTIGSDGNSVYGIVGDDRGTTLLSKYDAGTKTYSKPYQIQGGYAHSKMTIPVEACTTNTSGKRVDYYYIMPVDYAADIKYPALVDMTSSSRHDHGRDSEFLANCGIFFVSPNKLGILKFGVTPTEENTLAVYDTLMKNPSIDPHRIYIVGESITTGIAAQLVNEHPEMWRGLVLVEPAAYPDYSSAAALFPSVLISIGDSDQGNGNGAPHNYGRAEEFLRSASAHLVPARINYQRNTAHAFNPEKLKATYKSVAEFILDNR